MHPDHFLFFLLVIIAFEYVGIVAPYVTIVGRTKMQPTYIVNKVSRE